MVHHYRRLVLGVLLGLLLLTLLPGTVLADDPVIEVTVSAWVVGLPSGLTITYINDYEVDIGWTKGRDAENTMIRVKSGGPPGSIDDGYLVYYGGGESFTDTNVDLATSQIPYYGAWSQNAEGVWSPMGVTEEANFMSASFLFIGLIAIAIALTLMQFRWHFLPLGLAAAISWLALGFWLLLGENTNLGLDTAWGQVLGFVFVLMVFVPLLWFLFRMGKSEITVTGPQGTYKMWGKPGQDTRTSSQKVKDSHRARLSEIGRRYERRGRG